MCLGRNQGREIALALTGHKRVIPAIAWISDVSLIARVVSVPVEPQMVLTVACWMRDHRYSFSRGKAATLNSPSSNRRQN